MDPRKRVGVGLRSRLVPNKLILFYHYNIVYVFFLVNFQLKLCFRVETIIPCRVNLFLLRGCSYDTGMTFIPKWVLFQSDKMITSNDSVKGVPARGVFAPDQKHNQSGRKFDLGLHDTRMKSCTRTTVSFGLNSRMTCVGNEMWFRYHVNTNREIYGDEMNSFQAVCHSGMWIARLKELRNKGMSRAGFWAIWKKQSN